jgi:hypothetical protein
MNTPKTEQIRTLNDRLRQNLRTGVETAVLTTGVAALGDEGSQGSSRPSPSMMTFVTTTTHTKSTTLAPSKPTGTRSFSKSIITTRPSPTIPTTRLIQPSRIA